MWRGLWFFKKIFYIYPKEAGFSRKPLIETNGGRAASVSARKRSIFRKIKAGFSRKPLIKTNGGQAASVSARKGPFSGK